MKKVCEPETPITQEDIDEVFAYKCKNTVNYKDILTESSMLLVQLTAALK